MATVRSNKFSNIRHLHRRLSAPGKNTKILFVSAKKSKMDYDGTTKSYPNGSMMLFIPTKDIIHSLHDFRKKKILITMTNILVTKLYSVSVLAVSRISRTS